MQALDKKYDISELKKLEGEKSAILSVNDLENVVGGVDGITLSPAEMEFVKALMDAFKTMGYTRNQLIEEMENSQVSEKYSALYLEVWDSI